MAVPITDNTSVGDQLRAIDAQYHQYQLEGTRRREMDYYYGMQNQQAQLYSNQARQPPAGFTEALKEQMRTTHPEPTEPTFNKVLLLCN